MKGIPGYTVRELERARKSLLASNILLEKGLSEDSVSRAYYAVLHSAMAISKKDKTACSKMSDVIKFTQCQDK
jgi:uncharacterized protein (UPF0332 family)